MSEFIAALPMYDWPEVRSQTDAEWGRLREGLRKAGVDAPERLVRRNADMQPVSGGIRGVSGNVIAPDPAMLPPDELDHPTLWRHPALLFAQTCWGPMELGLAPHVQVVGEPDYSAFEGGQGAFYSSAIVMRAELSHKGEDIAAPDDGQPLIPLDLIRNQRFVYNSADSMSGILALTRDLDALGENLDIFASRTESGGHRASIRAVASGEADVATIDCRSWAMARRFEPAAGTLSVVGWTARRLGLPYIAAAGIPDVVATILRDLLAQHAKEAASTA